MTIPTFAVVGRPNKGKSSIVATLARDESVIIAPTAGTTRKARRFPMRIDDELLYELVDTPGIQRARTVLTWLDDHNTDAASRPETVRRFVEEHADNPDFKDEYHALKPIIAGAGIIYVVDGSCPFSEEYGAEMEILRWSGRPSLALINPIDNDDFVDEWSAGLGQYFQTVRTFDAHRAEIHKQFDLLELFGHLDLEWREPLQHAVTALKDERQRQHAQACAEITDSIIESTGYKTEQSILDGMPEEPVRKLLFAQYKKHLVNREQQCRKRVEELFNYSDLQKSEQKLALDDTELFDQKKWYLWGLSKRQMVTTAASVGGIVGGLVGAAIALPTGGFFFPPAIGVAAAIGAAIGALVSAAIAWRYADGIGKIKVKGIPSGGKLLSYGPFTNKNFPFVLLGRALLHHQLVSKRTHATQGKLDLDQPPIDWTDSIERKKLMRLFDGIKAGKKLAKRRAQLEAIVLDRCLSVDKVSAM